MTARRIFELLALGLGLLVWSYLGWDGALWDARLQLALHLAAVAAIAGLAGYLRAGGELPRTPLDLPILLLLLAFGIASLVAWNTGLSARALAAIIATVAMLPVALVVLRHRPTWTVPVVVVPALALAAGSLAVMLWRRLEWIAAGAPGLPPIRLLHEGTPFGSVAVPAFILVALVPLALLIEPRRVRRAVLIALAVIGVPTVILSGSRSAWIAIAVTVLVMGAPLLPRVRLARLRPPRGPRGVLLTLAAAAVVVLVVALVAPRAFQTSSLAYRLGFWSDTVTAWSRHPVLGVGPGAMPYLRQVVAPDLSQPVRQPHSHNVELGILGDSGLLGILAALVLLVAFVRAAGPWRSRTIRGRSAFAVLIGFLVGMQFEDLTFLPNFNLLVLLLVAQALLDADAVRWTRVRLERSHAAMAAIAAAALLLVAAPGDAAAIAYRNGTDAVLDNDWHAATQWYQRSTRLDPWHPSGPKALAVAAANDGRADLAIAASREALRLNPGDAPAWTNLALLCLQQGQAECARNAAERAVARGAEAAVYANAAIVLEALGDHQAADEAYARAAAASYWTALTVPWPRAVSVPAGLVDQYTLGELGSLINRRVMGLPISPAGYAEPRARALAAAMIGDWTQALEQLERAKAVARDDPLTWEIGAVIVRHLGGSAAHDLRVDEVVRGSPLAPGSGPATVSYDIATFRIYPADELVPAAVRLIPDTPWPWVLEPLLAPAP